MEERMFFKSKIVPLFFAILLIITSSAMAKEKLVLTLDKSVDIAFEKNPEIQMAEKQVAKSRASVWEAYSTILPQLNVSASYQHSWDIQSNTIPNFVKLMMPPEIGSIIPAFANMPDYVEIAFGLQNAYRYGATLTQPLYLGGAGVAGIKISRAAQRASEENLEAKKQNLIYQTANAFYACLLTQQVIKVQEEAFAQAEANLSVVTKKYNVGTASGFDKMRAQVEIANLKPQVISAHNNYKSALTGLRVVLGLDKNTDIEVKGSFAYTQDEFGSKTLRELQDMAIANRPEVKALEEQKYITQKSVTIARSAFLPKLFFQTDYSYLAMKQNEPISKLAQSDFSKGFTSAISLSIPIFTGFKNAKHYQKAKLDQKIMLDTSRQLSNGIFAQVEVAYNKYEEAKEKYVAANKSVDLAREALRLANMMYDEGANTQLDVLNSQLALRQARLNYVSSLYEYQMARYQLRKVTGNLKGVL